MNSEASFAMGLSLPTTWAVRPVPFENTQLSIQFVTEPQESTDMGRQGNTRASRLDSKQEVPTNSTG